MTKEKNNNLLLAIVLVICLIVLALLVALMINKFTATTPTVTPVEPNTESVEIPDLSGMTLAEAKEALTSKNVPFTVVATDSKMANVVEKFEGYVTDENGALIAEPGASITLHANEVGKDKVIYLTFDDGPTRDNTQEILYMLEEYGIKASFFVEGGDVERYPERIEATYKRGHVIACHSVTHDYSKIYASIEAFLEEVSDYEDILLAALRAELGEALGEEAYNSVEKIIRFPGGTNNSYLTRSEALEYIAAVRALGYKVYDWTALTGDADANVDKNAESFIAKMEEGLTLAKSNGDDLIVLMHDNVYAKENLKAVLDHLISEGYYFDTIDHCPEYTFVK